MRELFKYGALSHLYKLARKLECMGDRPRLLPEDRVVLLGIVQQEMVRRRLIQSDKNKLIRAGIDPEALEVFPEWMLKSKKEDI